MACLSQNPARKGPGATTSRRPLDERMLAALLLSRESRSGPPTFEAIVSHEAGRVNSISRRYSRSRPSGGHFCFRVKAEVPPASARRAVFGSWSLMGLSSLCFGLSKPFRSGFSRTRLTSLSTPRRFTMARVPPTRAAASAGQRMLTWVRARARGGTQGRLAPGSECCCRPVRSCGGPGARARRRSVARP